MEIALTVYDYDVYDMVDIAQLAVGDTIVVDGKEWWSYPERTRTALSPSTAVWSRAVSI